VLLKRVERYRGGFRFGGIGMHLGIGLRLRLRLTNGAEPIPVVAAREDATEGEDDDQEKGSAQGEAKGGSRSVDVWRRRKIRGVHDAVVMWWWSHSCVRKRREEEGIVRRM